MAVFNSFIIGGGLNPPHYVYAGNQPVFFTESALPQHFHSRDPLLRGRAKLHGQTAQNAADVLPHPEDLIGIKLSSSELSMQLPVANDRR